MAEIYSRQLEAVGKPGDVVFGISTSGNSLNVLWGLEDRQEARDDDDRLSGTRDEKRVLADVCLFVSTDSTPRVQEVHTLIIHILSAIVEDAVVLPGERQDGMRVATPMA